MNYRLVYNILGKENKETEKNSVCAAETLNPNHIKNVYAELMYPFYLFLVRSRAVCW